jgi:hypothetical protein
MAVIYTQEDERDKKVVRLQRAAEIKAGTKRAALTLFMTGFSFLFWPHIFSRNSIILSLQISASGGPLLQVPGAGRGGRRGAFQRREF